MRDSCGPREGGIEWLAAGGIKLSIEGPFLRVPCTSLHLNICSAFVCFRVIVFCSFLFSLFPLILVVSALYMFLLYFRVQQTTYVPDWNQPRIIRTRCQVTGKEEGPSVSDNNSYSACWL